MIILGILVALFAILFFLKKHAGTAILASFAGAIVYEFINGFFITLHKITNAPLDVIENIAFLILVLGLPLVIYLRSKRSWSPTPFRVVSCVVFSILVVSLCSGLIRSIAPHDDLSKNILNFIIEYRGVISTVSIVVAYFNVLLPHRDYD